MYQSFMCKSNSLLQLWCLLEPNTTYPGSTGKHWQAVGFQVGSFALLFLASFTCRARTRQPISVAWAYWDSISSFTY